MRTVLLLLIVGLLIVPARGEDDSVTQPAELKGTLSGRIIYDGTPPEPKPLRIPLTLRALDDKESAEIPSRRRIQEAATAKGLQCEDLIVGPERGIANV